jgi:hypothetical protein
MSESKAAGGPCKAPPITFATFVLSLAQAVMDQVGQSERDAANATDHLTLAKQSIDLLEMLECKTAGNLDEEESTLLSTLLYEVRMGYMAASKRA